MSTTTPTKEVSAMQSGINLIDERIKNLSTWGDESPAKELVVMLKILKRELQSLLPKEREHIGKALVWAAKSEWNYEKHYNIWYNVPLELEATTDELVTIYFKSIQ